jgi:hypothetical protein
MAAKKAKKTAMKKAEVCDNCESFASVGHLQEWLLIILGAIGLARSLNMINWPGFDSYFLTVFSVLVLVIGIRSAMNKASCTC